jgi:Flp pilus assembly protein TadB
VSLIAAIALPACVTLFVAALVQRRPAAARSLARARLARGAAPDDLRARLRRLPLLREWRPVDEHALELAGLPGLAVADLALLKVGAAILAAVVALGLRMPAALVGPVAFLAFVAPSEWVARRARAREDERAAALLPLLERLHVLAEAGITVEQALVHAAEAESALAPIVREAVSRARLGVPPFDALADVASRARCAGLEDIARELGRSRRAGRPMLPVLAERRELERMAWRARKLDAASRVDGALSLVLVVAYLPALLLLVVIPLFLGLLRSLQG